MQIKIRLNCPHGEFAQSFPTKAETTVLEIDESRRVVFATLVIVSKCG